MDDQIAENLADEPATPTMRVTGGPPLFKHIDLTWTYDFGGKSIKRLGVKHLTVAEVRDFQAEADRVAAGGDPGRRIWLPIFIDEEGAPVPAEVIDGLMDDDLARMEEAAVSFLPSRFRAERTSASGSPIGGSAEPTSAA